MNFIIYELCLNEKNLKDLKVLFQDNPALIQRCHSGSLCGNQGMVFLRGKHSRLFLNFSSMFNNMLMLKIEMAAVNSAFMCQGDYKL